MPYVYYPSGTGTICTLDWLCIILVSLNDFEPSLLLPRPGPPEQRSSEGKGTPWQAGQPGGLLPAHRVVTGVPLGILSDTNDLFDTFFRLCGFATSNHFMIMKVRL